MRRWPASPISGRSTCLRKRAVISALSRTLGVFGGSALIVTAARDRRHDGDLLAALERRLEALQEADVLVADVDVDEAAHALLVEEAILHPGVLALQIGDDGADGGAGGLHLVAAAGERAEGRGDADRGFDGGAD